MTAVDVFCVLQEIDGPDSGNWWASVKGARCLRYYLLS